MADSGQVVDVTNSSGTLLSSASSEKSSWEDKVNCLKKLKPFINSYVLVILQINNHQVSRSDLNNVVMQYLVREGFRETAQEFQKETNIDPGLDQGVMDSQIKIRQAIESGNVQTALEAVNDLDPSILDANTELFFHLQLQQLLEYVRQGDIEGALSYAQGELAARGEENTKFLNELEEALALFAYEDPKKSPFSALLDHSQRLRVVSEVNSAILDSQGQAGESSLSILMKLVLWSQEKLEKKNVTFPQLKNISEGKLTIPSQQQPMQQ